MNLAEFQNQTKRLIAVYGPTKYPQERLSILYDAMKYVDAKSFGDQITMFIGQSDKAPLLGEFLMAFASVLTDLRKREFDAKEKLLAPCMNCGGSGVCIMYSRKNGWSYAFQCTCGRGEMYASSYPRQYANMGDQYASHRAWVAGRFEEKNKIIRDIGIKSGFVGNGSNASNVEIKGISRADYSEYKEIVKNGKA